MMSCHRIFSYSIIFKIVRISLLTSHLSLYIISISLHEMKMIHRKMCLVSLVTHLSGNAIIRLQFMLGKKEKNRKKIYALKIKKLKPTRRLSFKIKCYYIHNDIYW